MSESSDLDDAVMVHFCGPIVKIEPPSWGTATSCRMGLSTTDLIWSLSALVLQALARAPRGPSLAAVGALTGWFKKFLCAWLHDATTFD